MRKEKITRIDLQLPIQNITTPYDCSHFDIPSQRLAKRGTQQLMQSQLPHANTAHLHVLSEGPIKGEEG